MARSPLLAVRLPPSYRRRVNLPRFIALITALAILAPPLAAEAQPPIRIGASASLTGIFAVGGQDLHRSYQLCVKHMNEKGGVLGRKLELVLYDDGSDPATAVRLYEKLIYSGQGGSGSWSAQLAYH